MGYFQRLWGELTARPAKQSRGEVVQFYQQFGFFPGAPVAEVVAAFESGFGGSAEPFRRWEDVFLLSRSRARVWSGDAEADVGAENRVYAEVLPEWGQISGGAFIPVDLREEWAGEAGPIAVSFQLGDRRHSVHPKYRNDYLDLDVLQAINSLILLSGRQFAYAADVNFAVVVCLTPAERERFTAVRAFPFAG